MTRSIGHMLALAAALFTLNKSAPPKLDCTHHNQGVFWPLEANHDPQELQKNAAAGELWLCRGDYDWDAYFVQTTHFFKWKRITVRVVPAKTAESSKSLSIY